VLLCAELINEAFLRQSAFSETDRFCPADKQIAMMQLIDRFIELSATASAAGVDVEAISGLPVLRQLHRMGEEIANDDPEQFEVLGKALDTAFAGLTNGSAGHAG
jgi:V/A-type H+-transporting ATPase subunit A